MITVFVLNLEASANLYNLDRHWMPSHPNEKGAYKCRHGLIRPRQAHRGKHSTPLAFSMLSPGCGSCIFTTRDIPCPPVGDIKPSICATSKATALPLEFEHWRYERPVPCCFSHLVKWCDEKWEKTVENWKSAAAVRSGMFLLHVPAFDFTDWGTNTMAQAQSRSAVLVTCCKCKHQDVASFESSVAICCNCCFLWGKWLDDVGCEQRWALVPVYVCLIHTFTINLMRLISRPVTDHASLYVVLLVFCLTLKMWKKCARIGHQVPLQSISARATAASRQPWTGCIGDAHCLVNCGPAKKSLLRLLLLLKLL